MSHQTSIPAGWQEFSSEDAGFSLLLPGAPVESTRSVPTPDGPTEMHSFDLKVRLPNRGAAAYLTAYFVA